MSKKKRKRIVKPKEDKQVIDGLNMPFDEVMKILANPVKEKEDK